MKISKSNMYRNTQTWNPFKGCKFDCIYCRPSFQQQAKRQKHRCIDCYNYIPHYHGERLSHIPSAEIIFICGNADLHFCDPVFLRKIIKAIKLHNRHKPDKIYYLQTKQPDYLDQFLNDLPSNVIIVTTLETNRDDGYEKVSNAPIPSLRYKQFLSLDYPRKVVTIEPVMDFDIEIFSSWIIELNPEYVWLGYNSRPNQIILPEPSAKKLQKFSNILKKSGILVHGKELRGVII